MTLLSRKFWSTPLTLKLMLTGIGVLALALCLFAEFSNKYIHEAVKVVGEEAAPSMIHAQSIKSHLADMDAEAANYLLGKPGQNIDALRGYEKSRVNVIDSLTSAAEEISYGESERKPILALQEGFSDYQENMSVGIALHERGDAAYMAYFRRATDVMHRKLLVEADNLDAASRTELDKIYHQRHTAIWMRIIGTVIIGTALAALLVFAQLYLRSKTNTDVNPYLAIATLIAIGFTGHSVYVFYKSAADLRVAKEDAFESIHLLASARAIAYDMEGSESRALLDNSWRSQNFKSWEDGLAAVVKPPQGVSLSNIHLREKKEIDASSGKLIEALKTVSFKGELESLEETFLALNRYVQVAGQVRALEEQGKHDEAVRLCMGYDAHESNWAFQQFDQCLVRATTLNQKAFDAAVSQANHDLDGMYWRAPLATLVLALLALAGIGMRVRLYSQV